MLDATEAELDKDRRGHRRARRPLRGKDNIALAVGKIINKRVGKQFFAGIALRAGPGRIPVG